MGIEELADGMIRHAETPVANLPDDLLLAVSTKIGMNDPTRFRALVTLFAPNIATAPLKDIGKFLPTFLASPVGQLVAARMKQTNVPVKSTIMTQCPCGCEYIFPLKV